METVHLARDGLYLKGVPGTYNVEFSAPGGDPKRIKVRFEKIEDGFYYILGQGVDNKWYYLNATRYLYLASTKDNSLKMLTSTDDLYSYNMFPARLVTDRGERNFRMMTEPAGNTSAGEAIDRSRGGCVIS